MSTIRPDSSVPIFRQIADLVRSEVAAGVFRPGDLIPSIRKQAVALRVNPNTVQRAYEELEREGLLINRRGTGMIVSPRSPSMAQSGVEENVRELFAQAIEAGRAAKLSRAATDALYHDAWNAVASRRAHERIDG